MMSFVGSESVCKIVQRNYEFHNSICAGSDQQCGCPIIMIPAVVNRKIRQE